MKIKDLSADMFVIGKEHVQRLEMFGKKLSVKTLEQKRQLLNLIVERFGDEDFETMTTAKVVRFLFSVGSARSSSWKNRYIEVFKSLYEEYVWKTGVELSAPKFPRFSNDSKKADVFSTEELNRLFDIENWRNDAEFLIFYMTASCGLRLGEARGLRVKQFDFSNHILIIDGFIRSDGTRTNFNKSGSLRDKKNRVVFVPAIAEVKIQKFIRDNELFDDDFLFVQNGKPFRQEFCENIFRKSLKRAKIEIGERKLTPHSLRYTYVTRMRRYIDGDIVRILAGHTSLEMTDYYTKPMIEDMIKQISDSRDAAEKLFL